MKSFLLISVFIFSLLSAQENKLKLSGKLNQDFYISAQNINTYDNDSINVSMKKRTPLLAGGLSFILPGAGQFYNEDYWKTALFLAIEAAAISVAVVYNQKGDDQTVSFQNFANSSDGWDVNQYANWSVDNAQRINPGIPDGDPIMDIFDNEGNVIWDKLNDLEVAIGSWYSHQLAPFNDQQYYEMIGKYQQFNPGWSDYRDEDYPPDGYTYPDPVTPTFEWYAGERGKANDYYNTASTAVIVVVANHILSAVEAALASNSYNRSLLQADVKLRSTNIGFIREYYPQLNLSYNF